ncbi:MAG: hypothetical protein ACLQSR_13655 [Limisphaerales bacterium]
MSLLNDALKRAHESQGKGPADGPTLPPLPAPPGGGGGWILPVAIAAFLSLGTLLIWLALSHESAKEPPPKVASVTPVASAQTTPAQAVSTPVPVKSPGATSTVPLVSETNMVFGFLPERWPKVEGIIYTAQNPTAIVNNQVIGVGDQVGKYRVKEITRTNVVFEKDDGSSRKMNVGE